MGIDIHYYPIHLHVENDKLLTNQDLHTNNNFHLFLRSARLS